MTKQNMTKYATLTAACDQLRSCGYVYNDASQSWHHPAGGSAETWRGTVTGYWFIRRFNRTDAAGPSSNRKK